MNVTSLSFLPLNWHKINFGFYYTTNVMYMSCTLNMYMNYYEIKTNSFQFAKHVLVAASKMLYETIAISLFACLLKPTLLAGHGFTYHACMLPTQCSLLSCSSLRSLRRIFKQKRDDSLSLTNPKCEADWNYQHSYYVNSTTQCPIDVKYTWNNSYIWTAVVDQSEEWSSQ